ncbi:MAG: Na+/H+ antiporter NhaA [Sporichthyaceae bacterium]
MTSATGSTRQLPKLPRSEAAAAGLLLLATAAAILWVNLAQGSYERFWHTEAALRLGGREISLDLQHWVNDGLMVFFFFAVGLEVKRELVMGELTDRRRAAMPLVAALTGLALPAAIYLAFNPQGEAAAAWGVVISTDTAFLLGVLALVGPAQAPALRIFLLTLAVADDVGALAVIALFYTDDLRLAPLLVAVTGLGVIVAMRYLKIWRGPAYLAVGAGIWLAMYESGVHPTLAGVTIAMLVPAYAPRREEVEEAERLARAFRQSPQPELARAARLHLDRTVSSNERLSLLVGPWSTWFVVPVFALANAGVRLDGPTLRDAASSPITLGIVAALVGGKLLGVAGGAWLSRALRLSSPVPGLTKPQVLGGAALSGIGFTISLFIVDLAFEDQRLADQARVGVLAASVLAALVGAAIFAASRAPANVAPMVLDPAVDPERDHIRGPVDAPLTLVEFSDFECPFCAQATGVLDELATRFGDQLRYVFRHLPLEVHPHAELAAEAAEAAAAQGKFWEMHDRLFEHPSELSAAEILGHAEAIGLDVAAFARDLGSGRHAAHVRADELSAAASGARGTPTFFVNGRRHRGPTDVDSLTAALLADREDLSWAEDQPPDGVPGRRPAAAPARHVDPAGLPEPDLADGDDHEPEAYPRLTQAHLDVLGVRGRPEPIARGGVLFAAGDPAYDLFVVLDGTVAIFAAFGEPDQRIVAVHRRGNFVGEYNLLTGGPVSLHAVALDDGLVLRVAAARLTEALDADRDLARTIVRAFLLRRARLLEAPQRGAP